MALFLPGFSWILFQKICGLLLGDENGSLIPRSESVSKGGQAGRT